MRPAPARFPLLLRRPPLRLVVTVVLAAACGLLAFRFTERAEAAAARYGDHVAVWTATAALDPGDVIDLGDVRAERRPAAFVPAGAVDDDPTGRAVAHAVRPGEVLAEHRLADGDRRGVAGLVPEGWRAVAVPAVDAELPVEVGQRVDVVAALDPSGTGAVGSVVAEDGVVVHVAGGGTVTVAVPAPRASRVVAALAGGYVALALVG